MSPEADSLTLSAHAAAAPSRGRRTLSYLRRLYAVPSAAVGATIVILFLALALIGPIIAPYGVNQQDLQGARQASSKTHWFGTDHLGRDVFSRVLLGASEVLWLSGAGTLMAVLCGAGIGLISGYLGGWVDELVMRLFDSLLALPALLLALLMLGAIG